MGLQSKPHSVIESKKQDRPRRASECSTNASSSLSSGSDTEDGATDKSGEKRCGKFMCPHCKVQFPNAEALDQHDCCMDMPPEVDIQFVGVNTSGQFQCRDCNQSFDTEKALSLHCQFIHSQHVSQNGYTLVYEFDQSKHIDA